MRSIGLSFKLWRFRLKKRFSEYIMQIFVIFKRKFFLNPCFWLKKDLRILIHLLTCGKHKSKTTDGLVFSEYKRCEIKLFSIQKDRKRSVQNRTNLNLALKPISDSMELKIAVFVVWTFDDKEYMSNLPYS